jgi:hypothetical protein
MRRVSSSFLHGATKRKHESDMFQEKLQADLKHWSSKQRTVGEAKLAARAAMTPLAKKKHPPEGVMNVAVKAVFTERKLTRVTHTQAANGQKAKVPTGDGLVKAVHDYLDGIEEDERTAIINKCCDKHVELHEEASSARATKKARSSGVEASSRGAPS